MKFYILSPPKYNRNFSSKNLEKISSIVPVSFFQFRPKHKTLKNRIEFVRDYYTDISNICRKKNIKLIINNDFEIAELFKFDGIHLGQSDRSCLEAKKKFGNKFIVGVSCSNSKKFHENAEQQKADYVAFGPVFKTITKKKTQINLTKMKPFFKKLRLPFTLIGGINHKNFLKLMEFNPDNLAIIRGFWDYKEGPVNSAFLFKKYLVEKN